MQSNNLKAGAGGSIKVVLVDDSAMVRERLAEVLAALENVRVVGLGENVPAGRRLLLEHDPDVLILDIDLPGESGIDLLQIAHLQNPALVIVMLTNNDHPRLRGKCAELGANFYFHKPTEIGRTIEVCQELVRARSQAPLTELKKQFSRLEALVQGCRADLLVMQESLTGRVNGSK